jgi:hypothetical protein
VWSKVFVRDIGDGNTLASKSSFLCFATGFGDGLGVALRPQGVKDASSPAFDPTPPSMLSAGLFSGADMVLGGVGPSSGFGEDQIVGIEGSFVKGRGAALRT